MPKVIVIGSLNVDFIIHVKRHPQVGETILSESVEQLPGGKGLNQAIAAARQEIETHLIGRIGDDTHGSALLAYVKKDGVRTGSVRAVKGEPTGQAFVTVDERAQNSIIVNSGANTAWGDVFEHGDAFAPGDVVLAQLETPASMVGQAFVAAHNAGATTILNPSPIQFFEPGLLGVTDILIVNEIEIEQVSGIPDTSVEEAESAIAELGCRRIVTTLGTRGARIYDDGVVTLIPPKAVHAIDTTGAGDCFAGTVAAGLVVGSSLADAAIRANTAAAISVTREGAAPSMPSRHEVEAALNGR